MHLTLGAKVDSKFNNDITEIELDFSSPSPEKEKRVCHRRY